METVEGELLVDTKKSLKDAMRGLIISQDSMLKQNLRSGTQVLHSESYPTQVFNLNGTKYVRVNSSDIEKLEDEDQLEDLLKLMLSIDSYATEEGKTSPEISDIVEDAVTKYQAKTGGDLKDSELLDFDAFGNYKPDDKLPLKVKQFKAILGKSDEETAKEESEVGDDDSVSDETKPLSDAMGMTEPSADDSSTLSKSASAVQAEMEVEQSLDQVSQVESLSRFHADYSILKKKEIINLNNLTKKLVKAFRGVGGKSLNITPRKHISAKALATDKDRMYVKKKEAVGKHIKMNLVIDMSGSMGGSPMKNAVSICYLFNKLAQQGFVTGGIFYSSCSEHYAVQMPVSDAEVLSLNNTRSSEGLARTTEHYKDRLKNMNLICITDGDIVDEPIKKEFWHKNKIVSTGVYVNNSIDDVLSYSGKMDKWFNHSLVRPSLEDLIQLLVRMGLKG